jgi:hypothetical protein
MLIGMCDDGPFDEFRARRREPSEPQALTLALLEDVAAVLARHGYQPLRGYALAELTASLYRLQSLHD